MRFYPSLSRLFPVSAKANVIDYDISEWSIMIKNDAQCFISSEPSDDYFFSSLLAPR